MESKKTILDYAKAAVHEFEKPVRHISLKYDETNKRVLAEVTLSDFEGNRLYYVYDEQGINYYLQCLETQEHKTITELYNEGSLKFTLDDAFLVDKGLTVRNSAGKKEKVSFDWMNGRVVYPKVAETKKNETKKAVVTKSKDKSTTKTTKTTTDNEEKKSKNRIRNLKIVAGITVLTLLAGYVGSKLSGGKNEVVKNNLSNTDNESKIEVSVNDQEFESTYIDPVEDERIVSYGNEIVYTGPTEDIVVGYNTGPEYTEPVVDNPGEYGSAVVDDDMETQIQIINDECFKYAPTSLHNLVVEGDRDTVCTIISMRNRIFNGTLSPDEYLNNVVNYIFECGNTFDGKVVKTFDSLSPYAQYIVIVASQSILQIDPSYVYSTPNNNYNYDVLVNSYDYMVDSTYRTLTNNGRKY